MGFIRGALGVFVSILLFLIFLVGSVFLTLTLSLQYDNVYERLEPVIQDTLEDELGVIFSDEIEKERSSMEIHCESSPNEYIFEEGKYTLSLSCEALAQGTEAVVASGVESLIKTVYYKEYTCDFWKCFSEEEIPLFLISEYARDYWKAKFYWSLTVALVLMASLFLLYKKKQNVFIVPGILLMAAAVPFLRIGLLMNISGDRIIFELLSVFFSKARSVFRISFFTGLGLFIAGIIFKLFLLGFKFSKMFHREESKEVKKIKEVKEPQKVKEVKQVQKPKKK